MAYATIADLEKLIGSQRMLEWFSDDSGSAVDGALVTQALEAASSFADGYISAYSIDQNSVPPALVHAVLGIAIFRRLAPQNNATDDIRLHYTESMGWLKDVARGLVRLGNFDKPTASPGVMTTDAEDRLWTRAAGRSLF
jgi:phage gp36-like protein